MKSICIYCGLSLEAGISAELHKIMMAHDAICPRNPLVSMVNDLTARCGGLTAQNNKLREDIDRINKLLAEY